MDAFLQWMNDLPDMVVYIVLWAGAGVENIVPAVPADTFVALGGFLAGAGDLDARWVFGGTWLTNVSTALLVYRMSHLYGRDFFKTGVGRHLLNPYQMERMERFYERWGTPAIFLSRFIPGVRAVVPVFAGATHQPWGKVVLPLAAASALWYGGLVWLGLFAARNLPLLESLLRGVNRTLGFVGLFVGTLIVAWWIVSRSRSRG